MNQKALDRNAEIETLMRETYAKAKELRCSIRVNTKTGAMEWQKYGED